MAGPAAAQAAAPRWGLKGGLSFANLAIDPELPYGESNYQMGFGGGVELGFPMSPSLMLVLEGLYVQKGNVVAYTFQSGNESDPTPVTWDETITLGYVVVSPSLRLTTHYSSAAPYFQAGAEIGFLLDARASMDRPDLGEITEDIKDELGDTDLALSFGAGLQFGSGRGAFFLEARYSFGLTDICGEEAGSEGTTQGELKTRSVYLFGGVRF